MTLNPATADAIELYLNSANSLAIAVDKTGAAHYSTKCKDSDCDPDYVSSGQYVKVRCDALGGTCGVFAEGFDIVWTGDVHLPETDGTNRALRVQYYALENLTETYRGTATLMPLSGSYALEVGFQSKFCTGIASPEKATWRIKCMDGTDFTGKLTPNISGGHLGKTSDGRVQIAIHDGDWPTLRAKLAARR